MWRYRRRKAPPHCYVMAPVLLRPRRLTITVPGSLFERLEALSTAEGRSLSNLAAFLLECALRTQLPSLRG